MLKVVLLLVLPVVIELEGQDGCSTTHVPKDPKRKFYFPYFAAPGRDINESNMD